MAQAARTPPGPRRSRKSSTFWTIEPFLPDDVVALAVWVADYYACGVGEAVAAAMPPRAWIESERHAHITEAGRVRISGERGLRRTVLDKLQAGAPVRVSSIDAAGRGVHAALVTLERDGLVSLTQPLKGQASAYHTVRIVTLTAQGHDIAGSDDEPSTPAGPAPGAGGKAPSLKLGERQRAASISSRAPDGIEASELRRDGIGAQTLARLAAPRPDCVFQEASRTRPVRGRRRSRRSSSGRRLDGRANQRRSTGLTTLAGRERFSRLCCTA